MIIRHKVAILTASIMFVVVLVAYYAFEHIGIYLVEKPDSVVFATMSKITSILLVPGYYLLLLLGHSAHAGINNSIEATILIFGSWFTWTILVICAMALGEILKRARGLEK